MKQKKVTTPTVSIVITTKNEENVVEDLLKSIMKQTYKQIEIILVDNNSSDQTKTITSKYTNNIYNFGPERSAQRNFGAGKSRGQYLLFLDADMELMSNVVEECVETVNTNRKIVGVVIPEESVGTNFWGNVKSFERSFYNEKGDPITDAARFFSKKVFFGSGGYDEAITGPEDWDLPDTIRKNGHSFGRVKSRIFHREGTVSLYTLFRKKFYYGLHAHKYLVKHNIPVISPRTVYFLRPLFYKNWNRLISHPLLTMAMVAMLITELFGGGLGYCIGRIKQT